MKEAGDPDRPASRPDDELSGEGQDESRREERVFSVVAGADNHEGNDRGTEYFVAASGRIERIDDGGSSVSRFGPRDTIPDLRFARKTVPDVRALVRDERRHVVYLEPPARSHEPNPGLTPLPWGPPAHPDESGIAELVHRIDRIQRFLRAYGLMLLLLMLLGVAAGVATYYTRPPPTKAAFRITLVPEASANPVERHLRPDVEFFASATESFDSPEIIGQTLEALGRDPTEAEVQAIRERLALQQVDARTYEGSYVGFGDTDEMLAFLDRHLTVYVETEIEKAIKVIKAEADFLRGQLQSTEADLRATEQSLVEFKKQHPEELPTQADAHYQSLATVSERKRQVEADLERIELELRHARERFASDDVHKESRARAASPYLASLADLDRKLAEERASGKRDGHPEVMALQAQRKELQRLADSVAKNGTRIPDGAASAEYRSMRDAIKSLEVARDVARKELAQLTNARSRVESIVQELPEAEARFAELNRSYDAIKNHHHRIFQNLKATELQLEVERASVSARYDVITPPHVERKSIVRSVGMRAALGAIGGLVIGIALGAMIDLLDRIRAYRRWSAGTM